MRTVLLCDYNDELSTEYLDLFLKSRKKIDAIVSIGDEYCDKRAATLEQRTGGIYKKKWYRELLSQETIPVYISNDYNTINTYNLLSFLEPDIIVLSGTKIIRQPLWAIPSIGILNGHAALLPYFRGCSCLEWSILEDFPVGVTCHLVEKIVDAGPIVTQAILKVTKVDSYESIRTKCLYLSAQLMLEAYNILTRPDFNIQSLPVTEKGPWYSAMNDSDLLEKVRVKIKKGQYKPVFSKALKQIKEVDVTISTKGSLTTNKSRGELRRVPAKMLVKTENFGVVPTQPSHFENIAKWMSFNEKEFFYTTATLKFPVTSKSFEKFKKSFGGKDSNRDFLEVYHLPTDKHIGHFELKDINFGNGTATLAHVILGERDYRGKGFGKELCILMADYGFNFRNLYRLSVNVHCDNHAAVAAYIKGGFVLEGTIRDVIKNNGKRYSLCQMSLLRPEWEENLKRLKK